MTFDHKLALMRNCEKRFLYPPMNFLQRMWFCSVAVLALAASRTASAAIISTTSYTTLSNAVFIDLSGNSALSPIVSGAVTITPDPPDMSGAFSNFDPPGVPSDPAGGDGYAASTQGNWVVGSLTLDFSTPVAAFGVTFVHFRSNIFAGWGVNLPAALAAFDGPNGSGNLLGSVTSSGWLGGPADTFDFVGLSSDSLNIRSVVLSGVSDPKGYAVDGYALSMTPVPEPSAASLLWVGLVSLAYLRRKGMMRLKTDHNRKRSIPRKLSFPSSE